MEVDSEESSLMDLMNGGNYRPPVSTFDVDKSEFYGESMNETTSNSTPSLDQSATAKLHFAKKRYDCMIFFCFKIFSSQ